MLERLEGRLAPAVALAISDPLPLPEGDRGTTEMVFVVSRSGDLGPAVQVDFATRDGTAVAGTDYVATSGTLRFAPGQAEAAIAVPVIGNTVLKPDRSFEVVLSDPRASAAFAPRQTFTVGTLPGSVAVGDFNGDGRPDLAIADAFAYAFSGTVSVLLNETAAGATTPSFAPQQTFGTGDGPISVGLGDFNGDGRPDIAVANYESGNVSVLLNETAPGAAAPSFADQQTFDAGTAPFSVAVGDVNGDGRPDLAVANYRSATVSVLLNAVEPLTLTDATATGTIRDDDAPVTVTASIGDGQSATVGTLFANPLAVLVRNAAGSLIQGVPVTFAAPSGGPGGTFGGSGSATVTTDPGGVAAAPTLTANTIAGSYTVTAVAAGGSNPATTFALTNLPAATATALAVAPNPATVGQMVTLTATVTGGAVPAGPPTGTVTFLIGGSPAGTGTLSNGTAAFTTSGLTAGTHQVTARYEGDATFAASTSDAVAVTVNPVTPPPAVRLFGTGAGPGGGPHVRAFNPDGSERFSFFAYEPDFTGGVAVAFGDVTGDGTDDLITGAGPGALPQVKLFDGATRALIRTIDAFEPSFTGGVYVAAADLDADGKADFVVTPGEGGGPRVRIFRGGDFAQLNDFFGIEDPAFRGGARAALADVNGDVRTDLLVAAGFGGGPRVAAFDGVSVATGNPSLAKLFGDIFVFEDTLRNGVFITAGDLDGDGFAEVIAGGGPGSGPRVFALSGRELVESGAQVAAANFFAGDVANRGGIRVVAKDFDGDGRADLVAGAGTGAPPVVTRYRGADIPAEGTPPELDSFLAGPPDFLGGVFVG